MLKVQVTSGPGGAWLEWAGQQTPKASMSRRQEASLDGARRTRMGADRLESRHSSRGDLDVPGVLDRDDSDI